jgi:hypothetical protein
MGGERASKFESERRVSERRVSGGGASSSTALSHALAQLARSRDRSRGSHAQSTHFECQRFFFFLSALPPRPRRPRAPRLAWLWRASQAWRAGSGQKKPTRLYFSIYFFSSSSFNQSPFPSISALSCSAEAARRAAPPKSCSTELLRRACSSNLLPRAALPPRAPLLHQAALFRRGALFSSAELLAQLHRAARLRQAAMLRRLAVRSIFLSLRSQLV